MRQGRTIQATIFEVFAGHQIGWELKAISHWLDRQRMLVSLVANDLRREGLRQTGRCGLPAETVLRCAPEAAAPTQLPGIGLSPQRFGIFPRVGPPAAGVVAEEVGTASDHQRNPPRDLGSGQSGGGWRSQAGKAERLGEGAMVRIDSTVTAALLHEAEQQALLWDAV